MLQKFYDELKSNVSSCIKHRTRPKFLIFCRSCNLRYNKMSHDKVWKLNEDVEHLFLKKFACVSIDLANGKEI